jgi:hypothetical protein
LKRELSEVGELGELGESLRAPMNERPDRIKDAVDRKASAATR